MIPRLVIGGVASGVGKTTVTVGLCRALRARGLRVAVFKCGPDYLDPTYHQRAAGQVCHNLDGWLMGRAAVVDTFTRASADADVALIEGVMGLFDGAKVTGSDVDAGSTAQIGKWLGAPVMLVIDAGGMARSFAALAAGFATFDPDLRLAALFANNVGSRSHLDLLRRALTSAPGPTPLPPLLGGLPVRPDERFPERHLGLRSADRGAIPEPLFDAWGATMTEWCTLDAVLDVARTAPPISVSAATTAPVRVGSGGLRPTRTIAGGAGPSEGPELKCRVGSGGLRPARTIAGGSGPFEGPELKCRIGLAHDEAFHFYYEDNLRRLEALGAQLVRFSPLADEDLPDVDALYFGGGYPELFADRLSANQTMRSAVTAFAARGRPIYGECGGLMYLAQAIRTRDGHDHPMLGLLPGCAVMSDRLEALGYVEVELQSAGLLGAPGLRFRGHQFRYSRLVDAESAQTVYSVRKRRGGEVFAEGYRAGNVLGSYVHAHWASNPLIAEGFVASCAAGARGSV
jgi:cobyrinic acid a,c-diamide synthase